MGLLRLKCIAGLSKAIAFAQLYTTSSIISVYVALLTKDKVKIQKSEPDSLNGLSAGVAGASGCFPPLA